MATEKKILVIALGGNAIKQANEKGTAEEQMQESHRADERHSANDGRTGWKATGDSPRLLAVLYLTAPPLALASAMGCYQLLGVARQDRKRRGGNCQEFAGFLWWVGMADLGAFRRR